MDMYSKSLCSTSRVTGRPRIMCWLFSLCQINSEGLLKDASSGLSCNQKYYTSWSWAWVRLYRWENAPCRIDGWQDSTTEGALSRESGLYPRPQGTLLPFSVGASQKEWWEEKIWGHLSGKRIFYDYLAGSNKVYCEGSVLFNPTHIQLSDCFSYHSITFSCFPLSSQKVEVSHPEIYSASQTWHIHHLWVLIT